MTDVAFPQARCILMRLHLYLYHLEWITSSDLATGVRHVIA